MSHDCPATDTPFIVFHKYDVFRCHFVFYKLKFCGKLALLADSIFSNKAFIN